jgi:hypothetical protein
MFAITEDMENAHRARSAHEAVWLKKVAAFDRSDEWRAAGYRSSAAALRSICRMNPGVARAHIVLARKLEQLSEVASALAAGDIARDHATVIATAFTPARADELAPLEPKLVLLARISNPHELDIGVRRLTDAIDGDGGDVTEGDEHKLRRYHASRSFGNRLNINGLFENEAADIHEKALAAELKRDQRADDDRTFGQRQADAMTNIMRQSLDREELDSEHGAQPHVYYVVHADEHPGATPELIDLIRTERRNANRLSATTLERIMCDCNLTRIIMTGTSEILDVGRTTRTATAAQWKALVIRDQHCQHPGCRQPPSRCQAHHRKHWARPHDGNTDLDNLELLCWFHHRQRHKNDATSRGDPANPQHLGSRNAA